MVGMFFGQMADAVQRLMVERADVDTAGGKTRGWLPLGDQRDIAAFLGKHGACRQSRHPRADDDYVMLSYAHCFLSMARMPR